jgi:prevent-host-death family protein
MSAQWQLQEAKNKFSEVVDRAQSTGPQEITRHGRKTAVVLSFKDYRRLKGREGSLVDFFRKSPLRGLSFERTVDYPREVHL